MLLSRLVTMFTVSNRHCWRALRRISREAGLTDVKGSRNWLRRCQVRLLSREGADLAKGNHWNCSFYKPPSRSHPRSWGQPAKLQLHGALSSQGMVTARPLPLPAAHVVFLLAVAAGLGADQPLPLRGMIAADHPSGGPLDRRHLALVINEADPLSEAIGSLYQRQRRIPEVQVIRVTLPTGQADLGRESFLRLQRQLRRRTPAHVQAYALAWSSPWRVGCQSITSAVSLGLDPRGCRDTCRPTRISPYHARGDIGRPWDELHLRPSMLLAASDLASGSRLIARGVAADGTAPPGTAYLLSTSDRARNVRASGYDQVQASVGPGFRVRVVRADVLRGARDVMAYFTGLAQVPEINANHFRPGAVADHLTSFGGQLTGSSSQMSALRWLEAGVTGSFGTVVEPCNFREKFPDPALLLAYYRRGDTLLEAYWRSVAMPDQGLFIGEPLARPWPARP
jgi:uncharacterized protein (TIGR03790 family)